MNLGDTIRAIKVDNATVVKFQLDNGLIIDDSQLSEVLINICDFNAYNVANLLKLDFAQMYPLALNYAVRDGKHQLVSNLLQYSTYKTSYICDKFLIAVELSKAGVVRAFLEFVIIPRHHLLSSLYFASINNNPTIAKLILDNIKLTIDEVLECERHVTTRNNPLYAIDIIKYLYDYKKSIEMSNEAKSTSNIELSNETDSMKKLKQEVELLKKENLELKDKIINIKNHLAKYCK